MLAAGLSVALGCGDAPEGRELSLAHFLPADHVLDDSVFTPFSQRLAQLSGGRLTVRQYPSGILNSALPAQYSMLLNGVADIALVVPAYTPDLFPKTDLIGYPGVCETALECTEALERAWPVLEPEYGARVLAIWSSTPPVLLTRETPVRTLEDLRGLKIRVSSRSDIPFIEALGASALMQPATELHQSLTTGVIDGVAIGPSGIVAFRLHEPADYLTTWLPVSGLAFVLLMNQDAYDALSPEEQGWIDDAAGSALAVAGAMAFERVDTEALELAREAGVEIVELAEAEKRRFERATAPAHEAGLARDVGGMTVGEVIRLFARR
ncbi:MAG: TRAP transporter substrate-binding protein [Rhodospirillales bacterium]|nr:TRAP transporter substrate-binding protein [Rhodospirillales bacterium]